MDYCLPHQRDELPTSIWKEKYQGGDDLPKVDDIDIIHEDISDDS